jgi:pimeloyl-ACP methyl ester carboxylesterase
MNTIASGRLGCTPWGDRDVQPYRVSRDPCRSHFAPIRRRHKDVHITTGDGVQLAVRDYDPPARTHTVVFLHGFCLSRASWALQIDYLLRRYGDSVRMITYDHRGHGGSSAAPVGTYRIDRLAADLDEVLTALHVTAPLTLVGHSMGAMVALAYLSRRASERAVDPHGLVLVATAAGKLAQRGLGRLLGTPATPLLFKLIEHTPDPALKMLAGPVRAALSRWCSCGPAQRPTLAATAAEALTTTPVSTAVGFLPTLRDYDVYRTLGSVRAQTVVVSGGADPVTPPVHSRELADGIPGAAHLHVPHAGHMLQHEAPHVIHHAIRRVITNHAKPGQLVALTAQSHRFGSATDVSIGIKRGTG